MGIFTAGVLSAFIVLICVVNLQKGDRIGFSKLIKLPKLYLNPCGSNL